MKKCFLWSIVMLTVFFTSCKQFDLEPDDNGSGTGSQKNDEVTYYIKHSWGSGADGDWSWQEMEKESNGTYSYAGLWGGTGANINTKPNSTGALWFSRSDISGASSSLSVGDKVRFYYLPEKSTLSVIKISNGNGGSLAKVRFRKEDAYQYVTKMVVWQVPGGGTGSFTTAASYEFGTEAGTTQYYEVPAQKSYLGYYNSYYSEYDWALGEGNSEYYFEAGQKYTYSCGDDGEYLIFSITIDGTMNAPQKVVAKRKLIK